MADDVVLELGWGRLIFGQTFADPEKLAEVLRRREARPPRHLHLPPRIARADRAGARRVVHRPQPHLPVAFRRGRRPCGPRHRPGSRVRTLATTADADAINRVYVRCGMVPAPTTVIWDNHRATTRSTTWSPWTTTTASAVVGTVTGVDHERLFGDPEGGSSLWCLAVDPTTGLPGVGAALTRELADDVPRPGPRLPGSVGDARQRGRDRALREAGLRPGSGAGVKRKNAINEPLFTPAPETVDDLNPYARIIADEAMRRGIRVEVLDAEAGEMRLSHGGRSVITRESLSEFTSAVAMSRCDDKRLTRRIVGEAGVVVPRGRLATFDDGDHEFLAEVGDVVVKPARGEQGKGITVGVGSAAELDAALARAREQHPEVLIEQRAPGDDLRLVVIDGKVVAAALRMPAEVIGSGHAHRRRTDRGPEPPPRGRHRRRIAHPRRRRHRGHRRARRAGHSTTCCPRVSGCGCAAPRTCTGRHHPRRHRRGEPRSCAEVAVTAAEAIGIPVTGIDLLVPDVDRRRVRVHRGQRAARAGQPRAAAHRRRRSSTSCSRAGRRLPQAWKPDQPPEPELSHQVLVRNTISAASCAVDSPALRLPSMSTIRKSPYT